MKRETSRLRTENTKKDPGETRIFSIIYDGSAVAALKRSTTCCTDAKPPSGLRSTTIS